MRRRGGGSGFVERRGEFCCYPPLASIGAIPLWCIAPLSRLSRLGMLSRGHKENLHVISIQISYDPYIGAVNYKHGKIYSRRVPKASDIDFSTKKDKIMVLR